MQPHPDQQVKVADNRQQFLGIRLVAQHRVRLFHPAGHQPGSLQVIRALHRQKHDAGVPFQHQPVGDSGKDILEMGMPLPFAHRKTDQWAIPLHRQAVQDVTSDGQVNRRQRQYRVCRHRHLVGGNAQPGQLSQRTGIANRAGHDPVADMAHERTGQFAADRPDPLRIQHDRTAKQTGQLQDSQIIKDTAAAGDIL